MVPEVITSYLSMRPNHEAFVSRLKAAITDYFSVPEDHQDTNAAWRDFIQRSPVVHEPPLSVHSAKNSVKMEPPPITSAPLPVAPLKANAPLPESTSNQDVAPAKPLSPPIHSSTCNPDLVPANPLSSPPVFILPDAAVPTLCFQLAHEKLFSRLSSSEVLLDFPPDLEPGMSLLPILRGDTVDATWALFNRSNFNTSEEGFPSSLLNFLNFLERPKHCAIITRPLFEHASQRVFRQVGRLTRDGPGSILAFWSAGVHDDFRVVSSSDVWSFRELVNEDGISDFEYLKRYFFFEDHPLCLSRWQDGYYSLLPANHSHFDVLFNVPPVDLAVPTNASDLQNEVSIASEEEPKLPQTPATNVEQNNEEPKLSEISATNEQQTVEESKLIPNPATNEKQTDVDRPIKSVAKKQEHPQKTGRTTSTRKKQPPSVLKCTGDADCKKNPTYARYGSNFPDKCKLHKLPDMTLKRSLLKSDKTKQPDVEPLTPTKKSSSKAVQGDLLAGATTSVELAEPKGISLKEVFQLPSDSTPTKPNKYWCKSHGCKKVAIYAHVSEADDRPVMCDQHAAGMEGCYKAAAAAVKPLL